MFRLLVFLLFLALVSTTAMWFIENDGSLTVEWLGYRIQTSTGFAILSTVICAVVLALVLQFVMWLKSAPKQYKKNAEAKKRERGLTFLTDGFAAVAAGDANEAKRLTKKAERNLGKIPMTRLLSAQTAQSEGNREVAKLHYTAMLEDKKTEMIAIKGLLIEAKNDRDFEKAIFLAEKALNLNPNTNWPVSILLDLYKSTSHWDKALSMLEIAAKRKLLDNNLYAQTKIKLFLAKAEQSISTENYKEATGFAEQAYKQDHNYLPTISLLVACHIEQGDKRKAQKMIEKSWKQEPHKILAELYASTFDEEKTEKQISQLEKLVKLNDNSIYGHIEIAKKAIETNQHSNARNHLKRALSFAESKEACLLMVELEKKENAEDSIIEEWSIRADHAPPYTDWLCQSCGLHTDAWTSKCSNCGSFGSIETKDQDVQYTSAASNDSPLTPEKLIGVN